VTLPVVDVALLVPPVLVMLVPVAPPVAVVDVAGPEFVTAADPAPPVPPLLLLLTAWLVVATLLLDAPPEAEATLSLVAPPELPVVGPPEAVLPFEATVLDVAPPGSDWELQATAEHTTITGVALLARRRRGKRRLNMRGRWGGIMQGSYAAVVPPLEFSQLK
jgi:hypothetical protein